MYRKRKHITKNNQQSTQIANYITSSSDSSAEEPSSDGPNEEIMNESDPNVGSDGGFGAEHSDLNGTIDLDEIEDESSDSNEEKTIAYVLVLSPDAKCFLCCRMCNFHIEHDLVNDYDWCGCFVGLGDVLSFDNFVEIMQRF